MKWNRPQDVPIPEYEDLLFVYESKSETAKIWAEGSYSPMEGSIKLTWGGLLYLNEVLYWARVEMP